MLETRTRIVSIRLQIVKLDLPGLKTWQTKERNRRIANNQFQTKGANQVVPSLAEDIYISQVRNGKLFHTPYLRKKPIQVKNLEPFPKPKKSQQVNGAKCEDKLFTAPFWEKNVSQN